MYISCTTFLQDHKKTSHYYTRHKNTSPHSRTVSQVDTMNEYRQSELHIFHQSSSNSIHLHNFVMNIHISLYSSSMPHLNCIFYNFLTTRRNTAFVKDMIGMRNSTDPRMVEMVGMNFSQCRKLLQSIFSKSHQNTAQWDNSYYTHRHAQ